MVVLQIEVANFSAFEIEGQPPVAAYRNAPCPGALALKLVDAPAGRSHNLGHVGGSNQHGENTAQPLRKIRAKLPAVVIFNEPQKSLVLNAPNYHAMRCTV